MKQFTFLADTAIGWDIIGLYVVCSIISLVIFYNIIKAAVKNGIIESLVVIKKQQQIVAIANQNNQQTLNKRNFNSDTTKVKSLLKNIKKNGTD